MDQETATLYSDGETIQHVYQTGQLVHSYGSQEPTGWQGLDLVYGYNAQGQPKSISYNYGALTTHYGYYGYNAAGLGDGWDGLSGWGTSSFGKLWQIDTRAGSTLLGSVQVGYDAAGNVLRQIVSDPGGTQDDWADYDALDRLTALREGGSPNGAVIAQYSYDSVGNLLSKMEGGVTTSMPWSGQAPWHMPADIWVGGSYRHMSYDANGNLTGETSGVNRSLSYDAENRLASDADIGSGVTTTFGYDPDGQRTRKTVQVGAAITTTYYAGKLREYTVRADGQVQWSKYYWLNGQLLGQRTVGDEAGLYVSAVQTSPGTDGLTAGGDEEKRGGADTPSIRLVSWRSDRRAQGREPASEQLQTGAQGGEQQVNALAVIDETGRGPMGGQGEDANASAWVSPTVIGRGGVVLLSWQGVSSPTTSDWFGVAPAGSEVVGTTLTGGYMSCTATPPGAPLAAGECLVTIPANLTPGSYVIRLFAHGSWDLTTTSNAFSVTADPPVSASVSASSVAAGQSLTLSWQNNVGATTTDWFGLAPAGSGMVGTTMLVGGYLSCGPTPPSTPQVAGACTLSFPRGTPPGTYVIRLFTAGGWGYLASTAAFTVTAPAPVPMTVSPTAVQPGGSVTFTWQTIDGGSTTDWYGLAPAGSQVEGTTLLGNYLSCTGTPPSTPQPTGSCTISVPSNFVPGSYVVRLFWNGTWSLMGESNQFTVNPPGSNVKLYWYVPDHLGGQHVIVDAATGAVVSTVRTWPYGETRAQTGSSPTDRRYTGQTLDTSTGLYYYGARYYSPALGRFVQPDSIVPKDDGPPAAALTVSYNELDLVQAQAGSKGRMTSRNGGQQAEDPGLDPQMLNRYSYVGNNPLSRNDPSGHGGGGHKLVIRLLVEIESAFEKGKTHFVPGRVLTPAEAQAARRTGQSVVVQGSSYDSEVSLARSLERGVDPRAKLMRHSPHKEDKLEFLEHWQTEGYEGHTFIAREVGGTVDSIADLLSGIGEGIENWAVGLWEDVNRPEQWPELTSPWQIFYLPADIINIFNPPSPGPEPCPPTECA